MNDMRKLMEAVSSLNESIETALNARMAQGDEGAKILKSAIASLQQNNDDDAAVDNAYDTVAKIMPELDLDGDEFWDAVYTVSLEEGGWYDDEYEQKMKSEDVEKIAAAIWNDPLLVNASDEEINRIAEAAFAATYGDVKQNPRFRQM